MEAAGSHGIIKLCIFLITTVLGAGGLLAYYVYRLRGTVSRLTAQKIILKTLLNSYKEGLSWWDPHATQINCTAQFAEIFNLQLDHPVTLPDIVEHFESAAGSQLLLDLQKLTQTQFPFERKFKAVSPDHWVRLRGTLLSCRGSGLVCLSAEILEETPLEEQAQDLKRERDRLRLMLDALPIAVWYRGESGRIELCNATYAGIVESSVQEVSENGVEWVDAERQNSPYHLAVKAKTTRLKQLQQSHIVVAGLRRLIELTEVPLEGEDTSVGYAIDSTEVEDIQGRLVKHIASYKEILQLLSTPVAVFGPDTKLQFFNQAYYKLYGFDESWLFTQPTFGEVLEDLRMRRKLPEQQNFPTYKRECLALFNNLLEPQENLIHQPDGHILRVLIAPYPVGGLFYLYEDVTDKLSLEQRFNTLIAVQKETIDHLHDGIAVLGIDFRLRLSNRALEELWGLSDMAQREPAPHATELLERIEPFLSETDTLESVKSRLFDIMDRRVPHETRLVRSDGKIIHFTYVPLPDGSHLLSSVDVSDSTKFELALKERNQALEQASRLKSSFISNVSYELRAPLNTIVGFTEMLMNQYFGALNERQTDYTRNILESAHRLMGLINDMIDMASIEAGQLTLSYGEINVANFLNSARGLVFHRANDQGLEVTAQNQAFVDSFPGDERRLKQALFNLLINAIKHTPAGGQVNLVASMDADRQHLLLSVQDTGVGFQTHKLNFPFSGVAEDSRVKKPGGVGLGLALVKSLVELHKGTVSIESEPGKGTTVTCRLPIRESGVTLHDITAQHDAVDMA